MEKTLIVQKLVLKYRKAAVAYGIFSGKDSKKTNIQAGIIRNCYLALKAADSLDSLVSLLKDETESVRLCAGAHLLFVCPVEAEETLLEMEKKNDLLGFDAMMTLREWRKGNLSFD